MGKFSEQTPRTNERFSFLPLVHTCDGFDARRHMQTGELITDDVCEVFDEKITYLFYGRAAYKYELADEATTRLDLYPVCFVFDFDLVENIERIFPFDSGAMHHGILEKFMSEKISLLDFQLEGNASRVADVILKFYGSNENYLSGNPTDEKIDPLDFESRAVFDMGNSKGLAKADERRVTIEIQATETVPFAGGTLIGVVVPAAYIDSPMFNAFCASEPIEVRTYDIEVWHPSQAFGQLATEAKKLVLSLKQSTKVT